MKNVSNLLSTVFAVCCLLAGGAAASAQDAGDDAAKAESLIRDAIKARGGDAYLGIRTLIGRGQYNHFEKGVSVPPQGFIDYVVYPDRERTEFGKGKWKLIQTNTGGTGWMYEAEQKMIRDQTEEQTKYFLQGVRHDLDNVLRIGWKEPGAKLVYLGRREPWKNTFSEAVRVDFADGGFVTLHFDTRTKLPMMSEYKTVAGERTTNDQVRFYRWVDFDGIQFPTIVDVYRDGTQTSRVVYESVSVNETIPEKLFAKPGDIKEVK
ncbi:MAG TPA: hypothetical protein VJH03_07020 [Blastocatellia bacterium]|nr:hypothetical protein [Blastocatellia bacterium]